MRISLKSSKIQEGRGESLKKDQFPKKFYIQFSQLNEGFLSLA
jgi:hypothetical protein